MFHLYLRCLLNCRSGMRSIRVRRLLLWCCSRYSSRYRRCWRLKIHNRFAELFGRLCLNPRLRQHRRWRRWYWTEYLREDNSYLRCFGEIEICERKSVWNSILKFQEFEFFLTEEKRGFKGSFHWMPRIILKLDLCYSSPNDWNHRWLCCAGHMQMFWLSVSIESEKRLFDLVMQEREMWGEYRDPGAAPLVLHISFDRSLEASFLVLLFLKIYPSRFYNIYWERSSYVWLLFLDWSIIFSIPSSLFKSTHYLYIMSSKNSCLFSSYSASHLAIMLFSKEWIPRPSDEPTTLHKKKCASQKQPSKSSEL